MNKESRKEGRLFFFDRLGSVLPLRQDGRMTSNFFDKLGPAPATPSEDLCSCTTPHAWKLMYALGSNPIACASCNLEVRIEALNFPNDLFDATAHWCSIWGSLFKLWLSSGEYEEFARNELLDLNSPANKEGLELSKAISQFHPCHYQAFEEQDSEDWKPRSTCPICEAGLNPFSPGKTNHSACHPCNILFWSSP